MRENLYYKLLKEYCDGLLSVQDTRSDPAFRGGFWCRSCKMIHGRGPDAVYPLAVMYKKTGEKKYLDAAMLAFDYGETMLCKDGALYNDAQANWRYTTVFHTISVLETVRSLKELLPENDKQKLLARAKRMAAWLYTNLDEKSRPNINYCATNALALQLSGMVFGEEKYVKQAKHLAMYAFKHFSENGLFYGESKNHDALSPLGCRSVDIGYDLEESIPSLVKYARLADDKKALEFLSEQLLKMTDFVLPDGGLDNSFGCRNNKWTYWGSRTSDGCSPAYLILADRTPVFAEAAYRNTQLLAACTSGGFLYGGPHYEKHGEYPCTHHAFEHANALAFAVDEIDEKYLAPERCNLPVEKDFFKYYPEINTYKMARGNYLATVTGYDYDVPFSGHASGGTLTMLYSKKVGPMVAASVTEYLLAEPTNMQQPLDIDGHRPLVPRLVHNKDGVTYSSSLYTEMTMQESVSEKAVDLYVQTGLSTLAGEKVNLQPRLNFRLSDEGVRLRFENAEGTEFILPLIAGNVTLLKGNKKSEKEIFFLTGGFIAIEHVFIPDSHGEIEVLITDEKVKII